MSENKIRPIQFFCQACGEELFQGMDYAENDYTLSYFLIATKYCSNCFLDEIRDEKDLISDLKNKPTPKNPV